MTSFLKFKQRLTVTRSLADPIVCGHSGAKYARSDLDGVSFCPTRNNYGPQAVEHSPYLFEQLARKRSRTTSSSMDDDMEDEEGERNFQNNNNRSPGSQGSSGWEVDQGMVLFIKCLCFTLQQPLML